MTEKARPLQTIARVRTAGCYVSWMSYQSCDVCNEHLGDGGGGCSWGGGGQLAEVGPRLSGTFRQTRRSRQLSNGRRHCWYNGYSVTPAHVDML